VKKNKSRRTFFVFVSLVGVLTFTSVLLLALAPAPLRPDGASLLAAVDNPDTVNAVFDTSTKVVPSRWKYIYIHHSNTTAGIPKGGDHFIITNGHDAVDGQIHLTELWNTQQSALPPAGASEIDPACISICVVGDFNVGVPTQRQLGQLVQLVNTLRAPLGVKADHVLLLNEPSAGPACIGRYFPADALRAQMR
jgi:hypothetical protein